MSRPKEIDADRILDAAEVVVVRDGAARLTLDAVAQEAGIAKASVIYDYKSKQALIKACIERRTEEEQARIRDAVCALGPVANAAILGRIAAAAATPPDQVHAVGINLISALAQDTEIRASLSELVCEDVADILDTAEHPRSALVAFLAVEGLKLLDFLGLQRLPDDKRYAILRDIEALVHQPLGPVCDDGGGVCRSA